jgi:RNA recognition motif-containing protein
MGIDNEGHSCGFCFVIYETKREAELACEYISRTRLNGRIIRVDMDPGYIEGREKGRGTSGQQRREDFRTKEDPDRPRKMVKTGGYQNEGRGGYYNKDRGGEGNRWDRG